MGTITFKNRGDFSKTMRFLNFVRGQRYLNSLERYGLEGVSALSAATPIDTGKTAASWTFEIERTDTVTRIAWLNTNNTKTIPIVMLIQHGHGTGTGGFVEGIDFINPAIRPVFDKIADSVWKEVKNA